MMHKRRIAAAGLIAIAMTEAPAPAEPHQSQRGLAHLIPNDVLAVYAASGSAVQAASQPATMPDASTAPSSSLWDQAQSLGLFGVMDSCTRQWLDSLAAASLMFQYPHAVALFDVSATLRHDGGHELSGLHAAVIIETNNDTAPIDRRVQHLLHTYTNAENSTLTTETHGTATWFTLRDRRLPDWCVIQWAAVGGHYVIAVGEGALARVMTTLHGDAPSLRDSAWFASAARTLSTPSASFWLCTRLRQLRRSVNRDLGRKISDVLSALRLGNVSRGLWATRREGRALVMAAFLQRGTKDEQERIADPRFRTRLRDDVIPDEATRYAILDCHPVRVVRGVAQAYLASRSPAKAASSRTFWQTMQEKSGIDIERDIIKRLGHTVVVHDYPPHPLRLPGVRTILLRVDHEPDVLRSKVDALLTYVRDVLIPPGLLQLRHTDDGMWHILYGLNGPALTVLDRWIVIGFTPSAVREVRQALLHATPKAQ